MVLAVLRLCECWGGQELKKLADIARKPGLQAELADKFDPRGWSDWEGIPTHAVERREDGSLDAVELSDKVSVRSPSAKLAVAL